jgi:Xaa-Pro aminopeptidase
VTIERANSTEKGITVESIIAQKARQAQALLRDHHLPLWIVQFARETFAHPEPIQNLLIGTTVTWPSAFMLTASGESIAVVATGDVANVESVGAYTRVVPYVHDIGPALRQVLDELQPARIGLSTSQDDDLADNLTHGMWQLLQALLAGTPYLERFVSAGDILVELRARKLPDEIERVTTAIRMTESLFSEIETLLGTRVTEAALARRVREMMVVRGVTPAWDGTYNPLVNFGPDPRAGHARPRLDAQLDPGMVAHVDLGIAHDGYSSDLQRVWFLPGPSDEQIPAEVQRAFDTVRGTIGVGFDALRPGIGGWEVDATMREYFTHAGFPEPQFAFGHQVGQTPHDGGAILGPRWPRYGTRPSMMLEESNVFALECGIGTSRGMVALEDNVLITQRGATYLSSPQRQIVSVHDIS